MDTLSNLPYCTAGRLESMVVLRLSQNLMVSSSSSSSSVCSATFHLFDNIYNMESISHLAVTVDTFCAHNVWRG